MPKPGLNAPRLMHHIGQGVATGMTQHVGMNREGQTSAFTDSLDLSIDGVGSERTTTFSGKYEWAIRELPAQFAQCPQFITPQRMHGRSAVLDPANVQAGVPAELNL